MGYQVNHIRKALEHLEIVMDNVEDVPSLEIELENLGRLKNRLYNQLNKMEKRELYEYRRKAGGEARP